MDAKLLEMLRSGRPMYIERVVPEGAVLIGDPVDISSNNKFVITAEEVAAGKLSPENYAKVTVSRSKLDQKQLDRIKRKAKFKRSGKL